MSPKMDDVEDILKSPMVVPGGLSPATSLKRVSFNGEQSKSPEGAIMNIVQSSLPVSASFTIMTSPSLDMNLAGVESRSVIVNPESESKPANDIPTLPSLSSLEKALNEARFSLQTLAALTIPEDPLTTPNIADIKVATPQTNVVPVPPKESPLRSSASRQVRFGSIQYLFFKATDAVNVQGTTHEEELGSPPLSPQSPLGTFHLNHDISSIDSTLNRGERFDRHSLQSNSISFPTLSSDLPESESIDTMSSSGSFTSIDLSVIETEEAKIMNAESVPQTTESSAFADLSPGISWLSAFYQAPSGLKPISSSTLDIPAPSPLQLSFPADVQGRPSEVAEQAFIDIPQAVTPSAVLAMPNRASGSDGAPRAKSARTPFNKHSSQRTGVDAQGKEQDTSSGIMASMMKRASWLNAFVSRSS
jgi:hypothetical protein